MKERDRYNYGWTTTDSIEQREREMDSFIWMERQVYSETNGKIAIDRLPKRD